MRKKYWEYFFKGILVFLIYALLATSSILVPIVSDHFFGRDSLISNFLYLFTLILIILISILWIRKKKKLGFYGFQIMENINIIWIAPLFIIYLFLFSSGFQWDNDGHKYIVVYMLIQFSISIMEEIFFRGFIFKSFSKINYAFALILTSILFALPHNATFFQTIDTFLLSIIWCLLILLTKSIYPSMILHVLENIAANFSITWSKQFFMAEGIIEVGYIVTIIILLYLLKKKNISLIGSVLQS